MMANRGSVIRIWIRRVWILCGLGFLFYLYNSFQVKGVSDALLLSGRNVIVQNNSYEIKFLPRKLSTVTALIFYPGGLVDPRAYVPLARAISESGYRVDIVKIPNKIAAFQTQKNKVFNNTLSIITSNKKTRWILSGHSRGGALASEFIKTKGEIVDGLVLIGTTHPKEYDLSFLKIDVTKISASNDGLASSKEVKEYSKNLPATTHWVEISGGNHSQFGYYGSQLGDNKATISRKQQQKMLTNSIINVLQRVARKRSKMS